MPEIKTRRFRTPAYDLESRQPEVIECFGRVSAGRGTAARELHALQEELNALLVKGPLFPGSLNVVLDRPLRLCAGQGFIFDGGQRMVWPAAFNGIDVWIYRWKSCPLHIIEVLSPIHLRDHFLLKDGDCVRLGVSAIQLEQVSPRDCLIWAAFWLWRQHWTYSANGYFEHVEDLGMALGAAQQKPMMTWPARLVARMFNKLGQRS